MHKSKMLTFDYLKNIVSCVYCTHGQECSEAEGYNTSDFIRKLEIPSWSVQCVLKFSSRANMS